jgi:hypothetical protein
VGVEPRVWSSVVLTVLRLLSAAAAFAVFLFASARSRRSIVSCGTLAVVVVFFFDWLQPEAVSEAANTAMTYIERFFI